MDQYLFLKVFIKLLKQSDSPSFLLSKILIVWYHSMRFSFVSDKVIIYDEVGEVRAVIPTITVPSINVDPVLGIPVTDSMESSDEGGDATTGRFHYTRS